MKMPVHAATASTRRRVLLASVLAALAACAASASAARAATLTVTPNILGGGRIDGEKIDVSGTGTFSCITLVPPGTDPTNASATPCATQTLTSSPAQFARVIMTATPLSGWQFVSWTSCPIVIDNTCRMVVTDNGQTHTPRATFVEIVPVTIDREPPAFTNTATPSLEFSSPVAGTTFRCSIDDGPEVDCASPFTTPTLADGPHNVRVTGVHNGDRSLTPKTTSTFTVDTVVPVATLDVASGPGQGALQVSNTETFKFSSTEDGTFECRLDSTAFAACTSPHTLTRLSAGAHTFEVRAVDRAGNLSVPASRSWSVAASDDDGDGFNARIDCDDQAAAIHPGATDVPDNGIDENCDGADTRTPVGGGDTRIPLPVPTVKPTAIAVTLSFFVTAANSSTKFSRLQVKGVPKGATVAVICTGKGCPKGLTKKGFVKKNASSTVSLAAFIKKPIPRTATITVTVSKPGSISTVKIVKLRKSKSPQVTTRCIPPGASRPTSC